MKKWTVILLYPDYAAETYGHDTFMTSVEAEDPEGAVREARDEACDALEERPDNPEDFFVVAVIEGEHEDINPER